MKTYKFGNSDGTRSFKVEADTAENAAANAIEPADGPITEEGEPTNQERGERVAKMLPYYVEECLGETRDDDNESGELQSMLADVMHFCDMRGYDFLRVLNMANCHHNAERNGTEPAPFASEPGTVLAEVSPAASEPPLAVVVKVEGGVVRGVVASLPNVKVLVADCDTDGCDEEQLRPLPNIEDVDKRGRVITSRGNYIADPQSLNAMWSPEYVAHAFKIIAEDRTKNWLVLYRLEDADPDSEPVAFFCWADDEADAKDRCHDEHSDCDVVWAQESADCPAVFAAWRASLNRPEGHVAG